MAEDGLSATLPLPTACPKQCNKSPFSALPKKKKKRKKE
jgi:hypothetical protein